MKPLEECEKNLARCAELDYPQNPFFSGPEAPCRLEAEVYNCTVRGKIPPEIDGTYYRVMPDAAWAPLYDDDVFINGDGCVNAVRIRGGHADFKSRYVRTEKFCIERAARKAIFGKYRNRYTDDPRVKHSVHSTANTHVVYFENQLLALKEDSKPYALDPDTLETIGYYDFHGQYTAPTHTAHPKIDLATGEYITMGYEAKGDSTADIVYSLFDKNGKKLEECWITAPYAGMMHDMAATDKWIVFAMPPLAVVPLDLLRDGKKHFAWDESKPLVFGILPRRNPKPEDVRWYEFKNAFFGHVGNAFDGEDGCVYLDAPLTYGNKFWFFPPVSGDSRTNTQQFHSEYVRWKFDPSATDFHVEPQVLVPLEGEMPRIDDRYVTRPYTTLFLAMTNRDVGRDKAVTGGSYNSIAACDVTTGKYKTWYAGADVAVHEVAFVPRTPDGPEADGYLITFLNRRTPTNPNSCIAILDTSTLVEGPIAIIELPFRLRGGIHGSWVPARDLPDPRSELCDMHGVTAEMAREFGETKVWPVFGSKRADCINREVDERRKASDGVSGGTSNGGTG